MRVGGRIHDADSRITGEGMPDTFQALVVISLGLLPGAL
jgi:hypothetical protein